LLLVASTQGVRYSKSGSLNFQEHTAGGTCNNDCGASLWDNFKCDFCKTGSGRGNCVYSPVKSFESKSSSDKVNWYEKKIQGSGVVNPDTRSTLELAPLLLSQSVNTVFDNFAPEMPSGRAKVIHAHASHCKIKFDVGSSPYTGLLGRGSHEGFIRMGPAADIAEDGMTPGLGFKFPRTGVHSGDFVAMWSTGGGQPFNFFASNMSNHVPPAEGAKLVVAKKFEQATICATHVGLSDFARFDGNGRKHDPKIPYKLFFVPTKGVQQSAGQKTIDQLLKELSFPRGTKIFDVYACGSPSSHETIGVTTLEETCGSPHSLGPMTTTGQCVESDYGDQSLHIRHTRIEEDWEVMPAFKKVAQAACGRANSDWAAGSPTSCKDSYHPSMLDTDA
jgi:hypothetical protein